MDPEDKELLTGMGNCYKYCTEDYEGTVRMVSQARSREIEEVKATLMKIRDEEGHTKLYKKLRKRLPKDFPL